ncbi:regulator of gluconeogenesis [Grosmannia clavigera kw1407]|uniref:GID complex catalytic subunit 2 n=1 Tax=Grosmannia clavigera (strain kw1407 / UAMH 11150) TaxID=655863 RepID=F0XU71_GROCL|nr:regulator of gluconeogenesis [Grosmannia clavigera kw1407]EFW98654.1 regulator of gluconeogenesis [Grosmannia clavigera kw1407]
MADKMPALRAELSQVARKARLSSAVNDVDKIIARLLQAREQIASEQDPHAASLILTKLQNPIKEGFETVNNDLKAVSKTQREFGKALDRSFPVTNLPTDHDVMAEHPALINRAIAMHLLREGHFDVARIFMDEARDMACVATTSHADDYADTDMANASTTGESADITTASRSSVSNFTQIESLELQDKFQSMYTILQAIKAHNLGPAIQWAQTNSEALESRGSNLEFELCKLQFIWLAKTSKGQTELDSNLTAGIAGDFRAAFQYARDNFGRFQDRHLREIQRLAAALVFASNIQESPYANVFETTFAFDEVAVTFTREFCSLLGLSAESPLYVAATAGTIALPRLIKFIGATRSKRTEWTTANELAFETPLPESMLYHSIFVCPVSKEQTTENNPPMRLPCGHVLAHDSLRNLAKGSKFKCPYCPMEGHLKDARQIVL